MATDYDQPVAGAAAECCNCCGVAASFPQTYSKSDRVRGYELCSNCGHRGYDYVPSGANRVPQSASTPPPPAPVATAS